MHSCEVCGNQYSKMIEIRIQNQVRSYWFDSLECAAHKLAPSCSHCGVRVLGHGLQAKEQIFCCAHCARKSGIDGMVDNIAA